MNFNGFSGERELRFLFNEIEFIISFKSTIEFITNGLFLGFYIFIYIFKCLEEEVRPAVSWLLPLLRPSTTWNSTKTEEKWLSFKMCSKREESKFKEEKINKLISIKPFNLLKSSNPWKIIKWAYKNSVKSIKQIQKKVSHQNRLIEDYYKMVQTNWHKRKVHHGLSNCWSNWLHHLLCFCGLVLLFVLLLTLYQLLIQVTYI